MVGPGRIGYYRECKQRGGRRTEPHQQRYGRAFTHHRDVAQAGSKKDTASDDVVVAEGAVYVKDHDKERPLPENLTLPVLSFCYFYLSSKDHIMAKIKKAVPKNQSLLNRQQIQEKLEHVLAELKPSLGEKKFKRRMKKAGKLISNGLSKKMKNAQPKSQEAAPAPSESE